LSLRAAVFASGRGSNFRVLADHRSAEWDVTLLVCNRPDAGALGLAEERRIPSRVISVEGRSPDQVATETLGELAAAKIDFVLLAGYLKLVPPAVVEAYRNRMLNVHPALLPSFGGKGMYGHRVHEAVLAAGVRVTGPTIHFVDERYDRGRILAQWPVPVLADDDPDSLARRVTEAEHRLFPAAVNALVQAWSAHREPEPIPGAVAIRPLGEGPHFTLAGEG
jgi:phosphoribosylglycinamide formyltransferase 1